MARSSAAAPLRVSIMAAVLMLVGECALAQSAPKICVDFEKPQFVGLSYGASTGLSPGDLAFSSNGVTLTVYEFQDRSQNVHFGDASIDSKLVPSGSNQSMRLNNINIEFNLSGIGFMVRKSTIEYLDLGGGENVSANGETPVVDDLQKMPPAIGPVSVAVSQTTVTGGSAGQITMEGPLKSILIGGQELWIDLVCFYVE